MTSNEYPGHLLFVDQRVLAAGDLVTVATVYKAHLRKPAQGVALIFEASSGRQIDIDVRGSQADLEKRYGPGESAAATGSPRRAARGRPRLGVVGREVTLLPRHWAWLDKQRGGSSAALRRLVDKARLDHADQDRARLAQDRTNRFLSAIAGNLPGFEEATRALFGGDRQRFVAETRKWPADIRKHARAFAEGAFEGG